MSTSSKSHKKAKKIDKISSESSSSEDRPYVEILREKFLKNHDASIMLPEEERVSVEWKEITYKVPVIKRNWRCQVVEETEKAILSKVTGYLPAGSLLGILGPSGAGKTTFLNVLSRRLKSKKITGEVTINGEHATRTQFQHLSGFVAQDDVLLGTLTAEEALLFAAELKLPATLSDEEKKAHTLSLLKNLGLEHVKDGYIGYTGTAARHTGLARGLSGGERKRVSVCFEMVSNPKVLFLDEPTSGLDSFAAKAVVENLRDLAFYGRTIIATIHQPSAEIYRMFDYLLLLAEGQTVYFGPAHEAIKYMTSLGLPPPSNVNPADFLLKVIHVPQDESSNSSSPASNSDKIEELDDEIGDPEASNETVTGLRAATHAQVQRLIDEYKQSSYAEAVNTRMGVTEGGETSKKKKKSKKCKVCSKSHCECSDEVQQKRKQSISAIDVQDGYSAGYFKQLRLLVSRGMLNMFREPALLRARAFQAFAIAILAGLIWLRINPHSQTGASDRYSAIFFVMTTCVFGALNGPTFVFPSERAVFFREKSSNMYSTGIYYLSKYIIELPINIIIPMLSNTIMYWMIGFNDSALPWIIFCVFAILLTLVGNAVGMGLTCAILDTSVVIKIQPLILLPLMIFSGFFVNNKSVPDYFVWLSALSFLKYAFRGCCNAVFSLGVPFNFTCTTEAGCLYRTGTDVLRSLDLLGFPIWEDAVILLGYGLGVHVIALSFLYFHVKRM